MRPLVFLLLYFLYFCQPAGRYFFVFGTPCKHGKTQVFLTTSSLHSQVEFPSAVRVQCLACCACACGVWFHGCVAASGGQRLPPPQCESVVPTLRGHPWPAPPGRSARGWWWGRSPSASPSGPRSESGATGQGSAGTCSCSAARGAPARPPSWPACRACRACAAPPAWARARLFHLSFSLSCLCRIQVLKFLTNLK